MVYHHVFTSSPKGSFILERETDCFFFHYVRKGTVALHYPLLASQLIPEEYFQIYYIVEPTQCFEFKRNGSFSLFSVSFDGSWLEPLKDYSLLMSRFLATAEEGVAATLFSRPQPVTVENKRLLKDIFSRDWNDAHLKLILRLLLIPALRKPVDDLPGITFDNDIIYAVAEWILLHLDEPVSLSELSKKFFVNEFKLKSAFKRTFGIPVISFQRMARVEKAKRMLVGEGVGIYTIAKAVGFINTTYFSDFFKRETGFSPSAYRKKFLFSENAFSGDRE